MTRFASYALAVVLLAACSESGPTGLDRASTVRPSGDLTPATGAWVTTDKTDYAPGETVVITGGGFWPGEAVSLVFHEEPMVHANRTLSLVADDSGGFVNTDFAPEEHDAGVTFTLVATGESSGLTAQTVFTDGNMSIRSNKNGVTFTVTATKYVGSGNCTTGPQTATTPTIDSGGTNFSANPASGGNPAESYQFVAAATSDQGAAFVSWTTSDPVVSNVGSTLCVAGFNGALRTYTANYDANPDLEISKAAAGAFSVGSPGGTYTITVENTGTASALGSVGLSVTDVLPSGLTFVSGGSANGWQACGAVGQTVTCTLAPGQSILPGGSRSFNIVVNVSTDACPSVTNSASVSGGGEPLANSGNNGSGNVVTPISSGCPSGNNPPTADAGGTYAGDEGSAIQLDGSGSVDSDGTIESYQWSLGAFSNPDGGSCGFVDGISTGVSPSVVCNDNGTLTVSLTVTDDDGASSQPDEATVTVSNVPPSITAVVVSPYVDGYVYPITGQPTINATYTDPGSNDTHTCVFEVFDYQNAEVGSDRACGAALGVTEAGVYNVKVTVTDDDGGTDIEYVQVVVYDPSAGFVTGGGWIYSYAGAYAADPSLEGKATFGFVSKYQKGATVPVGNTEFVFHAGNLNFHSSWYQWLVVNATGTRAQYKGKGTINGGATMYPFILTALDGKTGGIDKFRMQIFDTDGETVLYDNYLGGASTEQALGGGSVVIHTGKK